MTPSNAVIIPRPSKRPHTPGSPPLPTTQDLISQLKEKRLEAVSVQGEEGTPEIPDVILNGPSGKATRI